MTVRNDWVAHLLHYPLKELRRRQDITNQQIEVAYKRRNSGPSNLVTMNELQNMADSLMEAIYLKR